MDAVLERPADRFDAAVAFWSEVTGSEPVPVPDSGTVTARHDGDRRSGEPGTAGSVRLRTADGDDWLEIRGVRHGSGGHLPRLWVDGPAAFPGANVSPAGLPFHVAAWPGQHVRPGPSTGPDGVSLRPHQLCFDLAPSVYDDEVRFWSELTGWSLDEGVQADEFLRLQPAPPVPVRFLLQRLGEERPASAHLDVSCSDIRAARAWHESLGATFLGEWPNWSTFRDPAGGLYCLTKGDPATD
ncbi:hypothetical protein JIG36_07220 [Actinoplanes sp. LDG1-06]|uniref:Glyoxalase-like domain-containing protein n=1 Tax=Paractinoplanes ovalisporus TaxID=2810368 RepID=A0ABS2A679_9ACTN|nr:VOC family protein [Actinoplanes ovalisporus]MBM2615352.1 hypothetical protein [Actinoplanes ovalisporus]